MDVAQSTIDAISRYASLSQEDQSRCLQEADVWLSADRDQVESLFAGLDGRTSKAAEPLLWAVLSRLAHKEITSRSTPREAFSEGLKRSLARLYGQLGEASDSRHYLPMMLAANGKADEIALFADLIADDPPTSIEAIAQGFSPLLAGTSVEWQRLFPRLFDALGSRVAAPFVLDLANFLFRTRHVRPHPAADRAATLTALLGSINDRLGVLEERPAEAGLSPAEISGIIQEGVALSVSLCDALALCEAHEAIPKLHQTLGLRHRRLRTEAAAALARLGDKAGQTALVELAAEPSARLRVLAYADELELLDSVPEEFQTPIARAEAELATWLAEPRQFGVPPAGLALIDERTLSWPGFHEPQECYLFRFNYALPTGEVENIGIAGPLTHAFAANVTHLEAIDLYALFAGWQVEHDDITFLLAKDFRDSHRGEARRLAARLHEAGLLHVEVGLLGSFFGDRVAIATAVRDDLPVLAAVDESSAMLLPPGPGPALPGIGEAWCFYKGHRLLRSFNEEVFDS